MSKEGLHEKYHKNGKIDYRVNYKNGKLDGSWQIYHENGQLHETGNYKDGQQDGYWEYFEEDGSLLKTEIWNNMKLVEIVNYKNGNLHGSTEQYYDNGQLHYKKTYKGGKQNGYQEWYFESGQLGFKKLYKDGKRDGNQESYFNNGLMQYKENYKDGKVEGHQETYQYNGQKICEGNIVDGKVEGKYVEWYSNNQIKKESNYKNGKLDGKYVEWDDDGEIKLDKNYKNGEEVEVIDRNYILNNFTLYLTTVPPGGGGSFLGYLQRYCQDEVPYMTEEEFPYLNNWDEVFGIASVGVYGLFDSRPDADWFTNNMTGGQREWTTPLGEHSKTSSGGIRKTNKGNYAVYHEGHHFYSGVEKQWKEVHHVLGVNGNLDAHLYMYKLACIKNNKSDSEKEILDRATFLYNNQLKCNAKFPPNVSIDYNKFFIDVNKEEVMKFIVGTFVPVNQGMDNKLDSICDMIRTYTKLNKELLNDR